MERYTENHYDGNGYYLICSGNCEMINCGDCDILGEIVDRLAAYEDTGLEPEEIEQLKGEVFGLRLDKQNLEQVKQKYGEAREAICTHCMDVPCQGESCYWWQGPEEG